MKSATVTSVTVRRHMALRSVPALILLCGLAMGPAVRGAEVLHLTLDEIAGPAVTDSSGAGNDGSSSGGVTFAQPGVDGTALALDGIDGQVVIAADNLNAALDTALTVAAWVKFPAVRAALPMQNFVSKWGRLPGFNSFSAYDANTANHNLKYFQGAFFDGSHVYMMPEYSHEFYFRHDTREPFTYPRGWEYFYALNMPLTSEGYCGGFTDGVYVYFAPHTSPHALYHANIMRYDTRGAFADRDSWRMYNAATTDGLFSGSFMGVIFDGRYAYFVPTIDKGIMLRYDTRGNFETAASWAAYDARTTGGLPSNGYCGGTFDGRYVYFAPSGNGVALRYDTAGDFKTPGSWTAYDASLTSGLTAKEFSGAIFDGIYVYYIPDTNNGVVLRYAVAGDYTQGTSWTAYDAGTTDGLESRGFIGGAFDGRYVYFSPYRSTVYSGIALRYDTMGAFDAGTSWTAFDAGATDGLVTKGYFGCAFDGRFIYSAPNYDGTDYHCRVLRYDTCGTEGCFNLGYGTAYDCGVSYSAAPALRFTVNTDTRVFTVTAPVPSGTDFHHVCGVYDGTVLSLYMDGQLERSIAAAGSLTDPSGAATVIGNSSGSRTWFAGGIDDVKVLSHALDSTQVLAEYMAIADQDGDGMPDPWEQANFSTLTRDGTGDLDTDGLADLGEYMRGTDPANGDSDGDGLSDGDEVNTYLTDPLSADTDQDGMPDAWEVAQALDPLINDALGDPDNDGVTNLAEYGLGTDPHVCDELPASYPKAPSSGSSCAVRPAAGGVPWQPAAVMGLAALLLACLAKKRR